MTLPHSHTPIRLHLPRLFQRPSHLLRRQGVVSSLPHDVDQPTYRDVCILRDDGRGLTQYIAEHESRRDNDGIVDVQRSGKMLHHRFIQRINHTIRCASNVSHDGGHVNSRAVLGVEDRNDT